MCLQLCAAHLKVTGCSGKPQQTGSLKHTKIVLDPALFHAKPIYVTLTRTSPQTHSKDRKNRRACVLVIQRQVKLGIAADIAAFQSQGPHAYSGTATTKPRKYRRVTF